MHMKAPAWGALSAATKTMRPDVLSLSSSWVALPACSPQQLLNASRHVLTALLVAACIRDPDSSRSLVSTALDRAVTMIGADTATMSRASFNIERRACA